ncbi:MAG TPA: hypothetical protein PKY50_11565 [Candidatus Competibacter sp.]|nr:hypothetical protein [Candidatus Competibacter sp.]
MKTKMSNRELLDELAERDFGTKDIPDPLRGEARRLSDKLGCSPKEALHLVQKKLELIKKQGAALEKKIKLRQKRLTKTRGELQKIIANSKKDRKIKKKAQRTVYIYGGKAVRSIVSGGGGPGTGKNR